MRQFQVQRDTILTIPGSPYIGCKETVTIEAIDWDDAITQANGMNGVVVAEVQRFYSDNSYGKGEL